MQWSCDGFVLEPSEDSVIDKLCVELKGKLIAHCPNCSKFNSQQKSDKVYSFIVAEFRVLLVANRDNKTYYTVVQNGTDMCVVQRTKFQRGEMKASVPQRSLIKVRAICTQFATFVMCNESFT